MIRVRFAPSPTGGLHVGGLRTALYNVLFARKAGGTFILRIEDTDQERNIPDAHKDILRLLRLCGLEPDEGPDIGGPFAPYVQSQRLDMYKKHAEKLLASDHAYPCFCTEERLTLMRETQRARGQIPGYDRTCRNLEPARARERMVREPHVLRLKIPLSGDIKHNDLVWRSLTFPLADVDDQVLVKSDGFPTYHLANVVDDHLMEISHVIRGEEWLPSVPKHLLLYQFFGWEAPTLAHLPLILNEKRQKLSKREGAGSVMTWLDRGILPAALINYVALLGWHPSDEREFFTFEDLIRAFDLSRVGRAGAVFDAAKLEWLCGEHIKNLSGAEIENLGRPYLKNTEFAALSSERLLPLIEAIRQGLNRLDQLPHKLEAFWNRCPSPDVEALSYLNSASAKTVLPQILSAWRALPSADTEALLSVVRDLGKKLGVKGKDLWMPLRAALTGRVAGPELKIVIAHLGVREVTSRLEKALGSFS